MHSKMHGNIPKLRPTHTLFLFSSPPAFPHFCISPFPRCKRKLMRSHRAAWDVRSPRSPGGRQQLTAVPLPTESFHVPLDTLGRAGMCPAAGKWSLAILPALCFCSDQQRANCRGTGISSAMAAMQNATMYNLGGGPSPRGPWATPADLEQPLSLTPLAFLFLLMAMLIWVLPYEDGVETLRLRYNLFLVLKCSFQTFQCTERRGQNTKQWKKHKAYFVTCRRGYKERCCVLTVVQNLSTKLTVCMDLGAICTVLLCIAWQAGFHANLCYFIERRIQVKLCNIYIKNIKTLLTDFLLSN